VVHRHRVLGAAVGQEEAVEFVEFFFGEGLVKLHLWLFVAVKPPV
jgi:hypothetical protein